MIYRNSVIRVKDGFPFCSWPERVHYLLSVKLGPHFIGSVKLGPLLTARRDGESHFHDFLRCARQDEMKEIMNLNKVEVRSAKDGIRNRT